MPVAILLTFLLLSGAARALESLTRELLATGDVVPPLGRIGRFSAVLRGIDERGRLLVAATLSDGSQGLWWLDERGLDPVDGFVSDGETLRLFPDTSITSPGGRIALKGARPGESVNPPAAVFVLDVGSPRLAMSVGDVVEGLRVVGINEVAAISDSGLVVANVRVVPDGGEVPEHEGGGAALAISPDGGARIVAGTRPEITPERRFDAAYPIGVSADGRVTFQAWFHDSPIGGVYVADAAAVRPIVRNGDRSPSGRAFVNVRGLAVSPSGELLFVACLDTPGRDYPPREACGVYRTERGRVRRIAGGDERTPDGHRFQTDSGFLNDAGDVVLQATWLDWDPENCGVGGCPLYYGLLHYPARGGQQLVAVPAHGGALNAIGDVAVATDLRQGLGRWRQPTLTTLLAPEDFAPNGAAFAAGGLDDEWGESTCVADDGRVGAFASFIDGTGALLCADADGVHVVARESDVALAGRFWPYAQCAFADGDEMFLGVREGVFRAGPTGLERFIGPGDVADNGTQVGWSLGEPNTRQVFSVNRHGTVVVADGVQVLRRRRGGALEALELDRDFGVGALDDIHEVEIADDESIVAAVQLWNDPLWPTGPSSQVIHIRDGGASVIAKRGPRRRRASERVFERIEYVWARGELALFAGENNYRQRQLLVDLDSGAVRDLNEGLWSGFVIDFAADAAALVEAEFWNETTGRLDYGRFLVDETRFELLTGRDPIRDQDVEPVGLGAPGMILFHERQHGRQSLSISGPLASGRCPQGVAPLPTATPTPSPLPAEDDGCQIGSPVRRGAWPLLAAAWLLLARQRRRS